MRGVTAAASVLCLALVTARRPRPTPAPAEDTTTAAATTAAVDGVDTADDEVVVRVKSYIDAGSCGSVATGSSCGDSAQSYYAEFEYGGRRVVVANGIPDHEAEHDQYFVNPNTRCERWTYMSLPLSPGKASTGTSTDMGVTGLAVTGGTFYNHLSSPMGSSHEQMMISTEDNNSDVAMYNEGTSLDSCTGHSSADGQYHYHANLLCDQEAADPDTCKHIGYMRDGVPIYGYCNDATGAQFRSCYSLVSGAAEETVDMAAGSFLSAAQDSAYEFSGAADCNLDEANGAVHPGTGEYSYFMTASYPWVPTLLYGGEGAASLCGAA